MPFIIRLPGSPSPLRMRLALYSLLLLLMVFTCINLSCSAKFPSRSSLAQHQRYCLKTQDRTESILNATEKHAAQKARKRRKLEKLQTSEPTGEQIVIDTPVVSSFFVSSKLDI